MNATTRTAPLSQELAAAILESSLKPQTSLALLLLLGGGLAWIYSSKAPSPPDLPTINPPRSWLSYFTNAHIKYYLENGKEVMRRGATEYHDEPYNVITTDGVVTVLPPRLAHEIRNEPALSFLAVAATNLQSHLKGFDVYAVHTIQGELMLNVTRKRLPKILGRHIALILLWCLDWSLTFPVARISKPLAEEASLALSHSLGSSTGRSSASFTPLQ